MSSPKRKKTDSKSDESKDYDLPPEVMRVADRIGLRTNVPVSEIMKFVKETIGPTEMANMRHQTYNIRDLQSKMLRYGQKQHHVRRRRKAGILTSSQRKKLFDIRGCKDIRYDLY